MVAQRQALLPTCLEARTLNLHQSEIFLEFILGFQVNVAYLVKGNILKNKELLQ